MSSSVRANGLEVPIDASKPTVINININQPSGFYSLVEMIKSQWKGQTTAEYQWKGQTTAEYQWKGQTTAEYQWKGQTTVKSQWKEQTTPSAVHKGEQKVLGAVLMMIGLLCVSIGVLLCFPGRSHMFWNGSCFWTGVPFIVTGAVAVLSERRPSCLSHTAAMFFHLVSFGVAIGGIAVVSNDLSPYEWSGRWTWDLDQLCKTQRDNGYYRSYNGTTTPEPYDYRVEECRNAFYRLLNLFNGVKVLVLVFTCLALCISLYSLGSGIKGMCGTCAPKKEEEEPAPGKDSEALLAAEPPVYTENCSEVQTV